MTKTTKLAVMATVLAASLGTSACIVHHDRPGYWRHGRYEDRYYGDRSVHHRHDSRWDRRDHDRDDWRDRDRDGWRDGYRR